MPKLLKSPLMVRVNRAPRQVSWLLLAMPGVRLRVERHKWHVDILLPLSLLLLLLLPLPKLLLLHIAPKMFYTSWPNNTHKHPHRRRPYPALRLSRVILVVPFYIMVRVSADNNNPSISNQIRRDKSNYSLGAKVKTKHLRNAKAYQFYVQLVGNLRKNTHTSQFHSTLVMFLNKEKMFTFFKTFSSFQNEINDKQFPKMHTSLKLVCF